MGISPAVRELVLPAVLVLLLGSTLVALGNWQMDRLRWKEALIERVAQRPGLQALTVERELLEAAHGDSFFDEYEYRRAILVGFYDAAGEALVFTSLSDARGASSGPGYWVLTPFATLPDRELVYVNRGFVPEDRKRAYAAPPIGQVSLQGLIRAPERGSWFTPQGNLEERVFFARHPHRIAEALGASGNIADFFLDLLASEPLPSGFPQAGETRMVFTNNHLGYAVTWYGLAVALVAVFASFARGRLNTGAKGNA